MTPEIRDAQLLTKVGCLLLILKPVLTSQAIVAADSGSTDNCTLWNAALCKPAYQISDYFSATADLAVDGNRNPDFYGDSCFHTYAQMDNWWMVDLMDEYLVHAIVVTNRLSKEHQFSEVVIDLFQSDPRASESFPINTNGILCAEVTASFEGRKSFECSAPTYARYIKTFTPASEYYSACEIEVMVSKKRGDPDCRRMVTKSFNIVKNSSVKKGVVLEKIVARTAETCLQLCTVRGDLCNGFYWTEETRDCQMLSVNPYDTGVVSEKIGTEFFVEATIKCLGDGSWIYAP